MFLILLYLIKYYITEQNVTKIINYFGHISLIVTMVTNVNLFLNLLYYMIYLPISDSILNLIKGIIR